MSEALVSVVIPLHDGKAFIRAAVQSVLDQTHPQVEILVVDDGSQDQGLTVLESMSEKITLLTQPNRGVSNARNRGARRARGRYLSFLDQDDLQEPHFLATQVDALEAHPEWGLVYGDSRIIDAQGRLHGLRSRYLPTHSGRVFTELLRGNFIPLETCLLRRETFCGLGGFNESYRFLEDFEFCLRLTRQHPIGFCALPLARYRIHARNLTHQKESWLEEWVRILSDLLAHGELEQPEEVALARAQHRQRLGEWAFEALRRGDLAAARSRLDQARGGQPFSLWFKNHLCLSLLCCLPESWRPRVMGLLPRKRPYGVPLQRREGTDPGSFHHYSKP